MKYNVSIDIDKPIDRVIELFDNPENLKEWMEGLQHFEHLSGTPGQVGARSKLIYKMGKKDVEMIETITVRKLPKEFSGTYEADGVFNIVKNKFEKISDTKTRYISEQEFEFKGMMKFVAFLMPWAFKKQSMKYLKAFKQFVERQA
ncbi:SRPBCC family protein [Sediminicola sp. 1XM1-17]|uniref:SRPBCC family protein n=1 Tax=Sediminicola sp. 1XM1-17 TaxID=3127702 RepID=UPI00307811CC